MLAGGVVEARFFICADSLQDEVGEVKRSKLEDSM
jgi:hypothetical protein